LRWQHLRYDAKVEREARQLLIAVAVFLFELLYRLRRARPQAARNSLN